MTTHLLVVTARASGQIASLDDDDVARARAREIAFNSRLIHTSDPAEFRHRTHDSSSGDVCSCDNYAASSGRPIADRCVQLRQSRDLRALSLSTCVCMSERKRSPSALALGAHNCV